MLELNECQTKAALITNPMHIIWLTESCLICQRFFFFFNFVVSFMLWRKTWLNLVTTYLHEGDNPTQSYFHFDFLWEGRFQLDSVYWCPSKDEQNCFSKTFETCDIITFRPERCALFFCTERQQIIAFFVLISFVRLALGDCTIVNVSKWF